MIPRSAAITAMLLLAPTAPARLPTRAEAQALAPELLARRVLGAAGANVVAVDRPQWRAHCGGPLCPPISLARLRRLGAPPLSEGMVFYERAAPVAGGTRSTGLCATRAIHVYFTEGGARNGTSVTRHYGPPVAVAPAEPRCAAVRDFAGFFQGEDDVGAARAMLASHQIGTAAQKGVLPFAFTCAVIPPRPETRCAGIDGFRTIAPKLAIAAFLDVRDTLCEVRRPHRACYEIATRDPGEIVSIETTDEPDAQLVRVDYRRVPIVY